MSLLQAQTTATGTSSQTRPCILIPTYNNSDTVPEVIRSVLHYGLPIVVCDDGGDAKAKEALAACAAEHSSVQVVTHQQNRGKGAAVMTAARAALARGFSHGIQIDADGQHDVRDIALFLRLCVEYPEALILGMPVFDSSAPKGRVYGRKLTHCCIWLETLSFAVKDALCGFRCYPLAALSAAESRSGLGSRMDFDPGIVVWMVWGGAPVINVETEIRYFAEGVSHFRMVHDNVAMVRLHLRLLGKLLFRLPGLLKHRLLKNRARREDSFETGKVIPLSAKRYEPDSSR